MTPWLLLFSPSSLRKQALLVVGIVIFIISLPLIILASVTNLSALGQIVGSYLYNGPVNTADTYDFGECTYWVSLRRQQINDPIPNTWGNAITWAERAQVDGYLVDHTPAYGAIMQDPNAPGGLGHVAFVESVDPSNGSWTISEMNRIGWDEVDNRTLPDSAASSYNFIHDKNNP